MAIKSLIRFEQAKAQLKDYSTASAAMVNALSQHLPEDYISANEVVKLIGDVLIQRHGTGGITTKGIFQEDAVGKIAHHTAADAVGTSEILNDFGDIKIDASNTGKALYLDGKSDIFMKASTNNIEMTASQLISGSANKLRFDIGSAGIDSDTLASMHFNADHSGTFQSAKQMNVKSLTDKLFVEAQTELVLQAHNDTFLLKADANDGTVEASGVMMIKSTKVGQSSSMRLSDGDVVGLAQWSGHEYITLSDSSQEWIDWDSQFGNASLLRATYLASLGGTTEAAEYVLEIYDNAGSVEINGANSTVYNALAGFTPSAFAAGQKLDGQAGDYVFKAAYITLDEAEAGMITVYLNGQKLALGAGRDYELVQVSSTAGSESYKVKMGVTLEISDVVIVKVG